MRIVFAAGGYKPAYGLGGWVPSVSALAEALVQKGHEVTVVATNANLGKQVDVPLDRPVVIDGVNVWYFRSEDPLRRLEPLLPYVSGSLGYLYAPRMRAALEEIVPHADVVDAHAPFIYPTYVASRAALRHGKPLFYHQHGAFLPSNLRHRAYKKRLFLKLFEMPVLRRATTLIALSEAERDAFDALGTNVPCAIVPNAIYLPGAPKGAASATLAKWRIPPSRLVIVFLARLDRFKGADHLLEAFERIHRDLPDACLVMAGNDNRNLAARWLARAAAGGFADRVVFPGFVTGDEKHQLLERADLFCLPSDGEGLSIAVLEALAHRTAVMLSPGCNFPDAEIAGAGAVVAKDPIAMAEAMKRLLGDRQSLRRMGEAGRRLVEEKYSPAVIADRLIAVYETAISARPAAA
jgi:glycosyltransferase involved in cell wall biosynthesis